MEIKIVNCETGEEIIRELTIEEKDQIELAAEKDAESNIKAEEKIAARKAIYERLGLTEEEARLLLG